MDAEGLGTVSVRSVPLSEFAAIPFSQIKGSAAGCLDPFGEDRMTSLRAVRISFLAVLSLSLLASVVAAAQTYVTPIVAPTPPGKSIVVNQAGDKNYDPHVSADLVAYSNAASGYFPIRYFNLVSGANSAVPNPGTHDFLSDIRNGTIAFTRVDTTHSAIFEFDTSSPSTPPVEIAPQAGSSRDEAQIGDQTIVWQDFGFYSTGAADIVAYDISSQNVTRLTNDGLLNQDPGVSPDGTVIAWGKCQSFTACDIWSAMGGGTNWTLHQLTNNNGLCSHADSDSQVVVYSCNRSGKDSIYWQPVAGGTEQVLDLPGSAVFPSVSGGLIAFAYELPGTTNHNLYVFDSSTLNLYQITNTTTDDVQLSDISVTPDGRVRVAWQVGGETAVDAFTFNLGNADLAVSKTAPQYSVMGSNIVYNIKLTNNGPSTANSIVLSDVLPSGLSLVSCTPQDGTCGGTTTAPTVTISSLANGASENITLTAKNQ